MVPQQWSAAAWVPDTEEQALNVCGRPELYTINIFYYLETTSSGVLMVFVNGQRGHRSLWPLLRRGSKGWSAVAPRRKAILEVIIARGVACGPKNWHGDSVWLQNRCVAVVVGGGLMGQFGAGVGAGADASPARYHHQRSPGVPQGRVLVPWRWCWHLIGWLSILYVAWLRIKSCYPISSSSIMFWLFKTFLLVFFCGLGRRLVSYL